MCCCIPLRRLSYLGAFSHMMTGLLYLYYLGTVSYTLYVMKEQPFARPRLIMGLFYMAYYAAFLPPGIFIFWGIHKKLRRFLVIPSFAFAIIQIYGLFLETYFGFRPQWGPEAVKKFNNPVEINKLKSGYWMDVSIYTAFTIVYMFMIFFYYREIGPECAPVQSRYAQAYQQQQQQEAAAAGLGIGGVGLGGHHMPPNLSHLGLGAQPPVPFRPVNLANAPQQQQPMSHSLDRAGSGGGGGPCRNSTPCPPPPNLPSFNLAALANLTYEQQQQLLKLQNHPLILQHHQQQQQQQQQMHHQQSVADHSLLQQQFQNYAQMLGNPNPKNPKF